jgi:hypothetical protein
MLDWSPARKNNVPVSTIVQVTIKTNHTPEYHYNSSSFAMHGLGVTYPFLPEITCGKEISKDEIKTNKEYFNEAVNEFNNKGYERAIELLNKCIEVDDIDLNAYYLRAMIYIGAGKNEEACKDWSTLANLGQVNALKNLKIFCEN